MKNKSEIVIGKREATTIIIALISTQVFLNYPRAMAESAATAGWILSIYATVLTLLLFFIISKLYSNFEGKDILDISEYLAGNAGRIVIGIILIIFFTFIGAVILREFGENVKLVSLSISPISFILLFFITGMIVGAYAGLEALVRFSAIAVPIIAAGYLFILIGVSQYFDVSRILPILGTGPIEVFGKGATRISTFAALIVLFLMPPYIKTHKNFKSVGYWAIILSGIFLTMGTLSYLLVFPYPIATESSLPIYQLARLINYGRFFQRVESIFVLIWDASALLNLSITLFLIVYIFKKTFKLEYYKPLIIPFAILVFNICILPRNLMTAMDMEIKYFRNYSSIVTFAMTIVILLLARIKQRSMKKERKQSG